MDSSDEDMDMCDDSPRSDNRSPNGFDLNQLQYSTKKAKLARGECKTPVDKPPPRPPMKSAPPVSRLFYRPKVYGPMSLSFRNPQSLASSYYNKDLKQTYFEQCYTVIKSLGYGSFAEAFKVRKKEDGKYYAVKKAHSRFGSSGRRERSLEEVKQYEKLPPHPNIVQFFLAWEEDEILYMQLELCKKSLSHFALEDHRIADETVWNYFADLLFAVRHLHAHGMLHMDIKPENIFITRDNICKLGDLGLMVHDRTEHSDIDEGDARYLSQETLNGKPSKASDIFSLGVTLLEIASDLDIPKTGPLWQDFRQEWIPLTMLKHRSRKLIKTIKWMLRHDPALRPSAENILEHPEIYDKFEQRERLYNFPRKIVKKTGAPSLREMATRTFIPSEEQDEGAVGGSDEDMLDVSMTNDSRAADEVDGLLPTCNAVLTNPLLPQDPDLYKNRLVASEPLLRSRVLFAHTPSRLKASVACRMQRRGLFERRVRKAIEAKDYGKFLGCRSAAELSFGEEDAQDQAKANCTPRNLMMLFDASMDGDDDDINPCPKRPSSAVGGATPSRKREKPDFNGDEPHFNSKMKLNLDSDSEDL